MKTTYRRKKEIYIEKIKNINIFMHIKINMIHGEKTFF
jgi:hypothetical protein